MNQNKISGLRAVSHRLEAGQIVEFILTLERNET